MSVKFHIMQIRTSTDHADSRQKIGQHPAAPGLRRHVVTGPSEASNYQVLCFHHIVVELALVHPVSCTLQRVGSN